MPIRELNRTVCQFPNGVYTLFYQGDEIVLEATNDEEAMIAGEKLLKELEEGQDED
jgi:hypothetical protein